MHLTEACTQLRAFKIRRIIKKDKNVLNVCKECNAANSRYDFKDRRNNKQEEEKRIKTKHR